VLQCVLNHSKKMNYSVLYATVCCGTLIVNYEVEIVSNEVKRNLTSTVGEKL